METLAKEAIHTLVFIMCASISIVMVSLVVAFGYWLYRELKDDK